jgi:hypothetical protein
MASAMQAYSPERAFSSAVTRASRCLELGAGACQYLSLHVELFAGDQIELGKNSRRAQLWHSFQYP